MVDRTGVVCGSKLLSGVWALFFVCLIISGTGYSSTPVDQVGSRTHLHQIANKILRMRSGDDFQGYSIANATVQPSQTICSLLEPYSIADSLIYRAAAEAEPVFDVRRIRAGNTYSVVFDPDENNQARYLIYDDTPETYVLFDFFGPVKVQAGQKTITIQPRVAKGIVRGSLWESLQSYNHHADLILGLAGIFSGSMDFSRLGRDDTFRILYDEKIVSGQSVGIKGIQAAALTVNGVTYQAFYFCYGEKSGFYDENGNSLEKTFLKTPLTYTRLTSGYTPRRLHPVTKKYRSHPGIDFAAPAGTPVKAVGDGTVIFRGYSPSAGNYIKIRHSASQISEYLHLSKFAAGLKKNMPVEKGAIIGYVGQTGYATGPHLDFRFMENGHYLDYLKMSFPDAHSLPAEYRELFEKQVMLTAMLYQLADDSSTVSAAAAAPDRAADPDGAPSARRPMPL